MKYCAVEVRATIVGHLRVDVKEKLNAVGATLTAHGKEKKS